MLQFRIVYAIFTFLISTALYCQNKVLDFNGVDDYILINSDTFFTGNLTVEAKIFAQSHNTFARVFDFGNGPANNNVWLGYDWATGYLLLETWNAGIGGTRVVSSAQLPLNEWIHVTATLNGNIGKIYYDCTEQGQNILNPPTSIRRDSNFLAKSNWPDEYNDFIIDELRIWSKALDTSEIRMFKDSLLSGNEDYLVALWEFNENNVDSIFDKTKSENHGIIKGNPQRHILCHNGFYDDDNDGVCSNLDCNDNDQSNTGTLDCAGVCNGSAVDMDGDGVCSTEDCDDNDKEVQYFNCKNECLPVIIDTSGLLLYVGFNGNLQGHNNEHPTDTTGINFSPGLLNQALTHDYGTDLRYSIVDNINPNIGTLQFWVKSNKASSSFSNDWLFSVDGSLIISLNQGFLRFVINAEDSEVGNHHDISNWRTGEWHNIAYSWNTSDSIKAYVDGILVNSYKAIPEDSVKFALSKINIGGYFGVGSPESDFDELFIYEEEKPASFILSNFQTHISIDSLSFRHELTDKILDTLCLMPTWKRSFILESFDCFGKRSVDPSLVNWHSSDSSIAFINSDGRLWGIDGGIAEITGCIDAVCTSFVAQVEAPGLQPEFEEVDSFLSTLDSSALNVIPVVILRFIPTKDGINLDVSQTPDFFSPGHITITELKNQLLEYDKRVKYMIEEGSKFRGYKDDQSPSSIGYKVIKIINIYENTPPGRYMNGGGVNLYFADWNQVFERFNLEHYINDLGVKEVWTWFSQFDANFPSYDPNIHKQDNLRALQESNMSSALTGDISNSYRFQDDLPIYNHSYVLYGQNFRRTQAEAIHNRGHQFEAMFSYINYLQDGNSDLYWKKFVGQNEHGNWITGRNGWTHMPPNTINHYDYYNPTLVESDIENWNPDSLGMTKQVNVNTWNNLPYSWNGEDKNQIPQLGESQWYIYWMQSFPGFDNKITYQGDKRMTNWWNIFANWDNVITNNIGLYEPLCTDDLTIPDPAPTAVFSENGPLDYGGLVPASSNVVFTSDEALNFHKSMTIDYGAIFKADIRDCGTIGESSFKYPYNSKKTMILNSKLDRNSHTRSNICKGRVLNNLSNQIID